MRSLVISVLILSIAVISQNLVAANTYVERNISTKDSSIQIMPNPSDGPFTIKGLDLWVGGFLKVYNSIGQEIGRVRIVPS